MEGRSSREVPEFQRDLGSSFSGGMMQNIRITDAVRCLLLNVPNAPNLVCPGDTLPTGGGIKRSSIWRDALAQPRHRITLLSWNGPRLVGLVSARARRGPRVWEIDRLHIPDRATADLPSMSQGNAISRHHPENPALLSLLDGLAPEVGHRKAERIFIRIPAGSPLASRAQRAGFFPLLEESLLEGRGIGVAVRHGEAPAGLQPREPRDDYPLFQLFCAATPQRVRSGLGLTYDQWRDAQEPAGRVYQQLVLREQDRVTGMLAVHSSNGLETGRIISHPGYPGSLATLVEHAMARPFSSRWLVPGYLERERDALLRYGLQETARFTVLVKTVAVPVVERGMAAVEA